MTDADLVKRLQQIAETHGDVAGCHADNFIEWQAAQRIKELEGLVTEYAEREETYTASYTDLISNIDEMRKGNGRGYVTVLTGEDGYVTVDVVRATDSEGGGG